ncbi:MAG TPA: MFS transporter [Lacipirellulaceae bacterium]|jgi:MFS family permease|nr:MFS transporter [Lacipirellulaceae bacterium]
MAKERYRWTHELTAYHWFVFLVASGAWLFDCLDQRLFSLARIPALRSLMVGAEESVVQATGKEVTAVFLIGWGIGGLIFGALGDRYGRARMLNLTVVIYSMFTGLTFFSTTYWDFAICRFLTGLGVGGVFGLAVALMAETLPDSARAGALGMLQILSTVGNVSAGLFLTLSAYLPTGNSLVPAGQPWRYMFLVGAVPALLVVATGRYLKEPPRWLKAKEEGTLPKGSIFAPYRDLIQDERWRKNLVVGALIASTGVIGLWAIGEYAVDLQRNVFKTYYVNNPPIGITDTNAAIAASVNTAISWAYVLNMLGAGIGMWIFTKLAIGLGRRPAFAIGFLAALITTVLVYWRMSSPWDAYWMMPLMGAAQLSVFAGFAIYLPELFPSRLRSTGTSFCYNLGRFAAAAGSFFSAILSTRAFGAFESPLNLRYSAMAMCSIFLVGLLTLPFAPETKDQPLPE